MTNPTWIDYPPHSVSHPSPVAIGEVVAGKYRLDRVLGEGGMGVVVAAHHLELDQTVAIKFLLDDLATNAEAAERFRREARAAAKIQSDHVVRVLDVGLLQGGARYMVMEYLEGHDLSEELRQHGRLSVEQALDYVRQALDAVGQAHAAGIVHRDLKPANLFLARRADGSSRIKVLDFGISKSVSGTTEQELSLTRTSAWVGSPLYMAPEQMQSARDVDGRADIWSIGAILYELIAGQPPYVAENLPQLCKLLLTTDALPLCEVCPEVAPPVSQLVMRCLSRDIEQRWQTVSLLLGALAEAGAGPPRPSFPDAPRTAPAFAATEVGAATPEATFRTPSMSTSASDEPVAGAGVDARTQAAWGRTGSAPRPRRSQLWIALAGLGTLAVGGALLMARSAGSSVDETSATSEETSATSEPAPLEAQQAVATEPKEPDAPDPTAPSEDTAPDPVEAPSQNEPSPAAAPQRPLTPQGSTGDPPSPSSPKAPSQPKSPAKPSSPSPAPQATSSTPSSGSISDFGGRR